MHKFCLIASFPSSVLRFRGELLKALAKKDLEIHIIIPYIDDTNDLGLRNKLLGLGYHLHEIPMQRTGLNPIHDLRTIWNVYLKLKKIRPDYVLAYTIKPVVYGAIAARFADISRCYALITGLGYAFQNVEDKKSPVTKLQKLIFWMYRIGLSSIEKVIFQNPDDLSLFRSIGIINESTKTGLVNGSGVDTILYKQSTFPKNIKEEVIPHFLLIARLLGDKGVREYAQAASKIKLKYPHVIFSLVGWIDANPDAIRKEELDEWVSDGRLNYLGKLNDVREAIKDSSIYVLPSYREGTPRTVLEAMSMGRPVITTDAPGCRETVIDGENGFLVEVKSVSSLVMAMEKFINSPELIKTMGIKSRKLAEEKFDVNKVNQTMLEEMGIF